MSRPTVAVVGLPNVGKSSLFNTLLASDRAIVTEHAGTTRDTLEDDLDLDGIPVRLVDTAGLREAEHPAESEGVRRARAARAEADLVLLVLDGSRAPTEQELEALAGMAAGTEAARTVTVVNKCDLLEKAELPTELPRVSALTGEGLGALRAALRERLLGSETLERPMITDVRHARAVALAGEALERARRAFGDGLSEELVLEDLKLAMAHLGAITGEFTNEDLYDRIFSTFCIGK